MTPSLRSQPAGSGHSFTRALRRLTTLVLVSGTATALAANDTWIGAGLAGNWSDPANWLGETIPSAGDALYFDGSSQLLSNNDLTGFTTVNNGAGLTFNTAAGAFVLGGNSVSLGGGVADYSGNLETINLGLALQATQSFTVAPGGTLAVGGVISGTGFGLTKLGGGTLSLTGSNAYTGNTTVSAGTLKLDFSAPGAPATNILSASTPLRLGGGTLQVVGSTSGGTSQAFASTAVLPGAATLSAAAASGASLPTVALGALTPATGGTVEIIGPSTDTGATLGTSNPIAATATFTASGTTSTGGIITSTASGANAGLYATVGLYDWAALSGGSVVGGSQISGFYTQAASGNVPAGTNVDVTGNITSHGTTTVSSIRFNTNATITETIATVVATGGVLVTPNVGANDVTISGGSSLDPSRSVVNAETVFWQNNTQGFLNLAVTFDNSKSSTGSYVQAGPGTVVISGTNTYSGQSYLNGGVTQIGADVNLGVVTAAAPVNLNGGALVGNANFTLDGGSTANARPVAIGSNGATLAALTGTTLTVDGAISGTSNGALNIGYGLLPGTGNYNNQTTANAAQYGDGTVVLSGNNSYTGPTVVTNSTLAVTTLNVGGTNSSLGAASANASNLILNGGTLQYLGAGSTTDRNFTVGSTSLTLDASGTGAVVFSNTSSPAYSSAVASSAVILNLQGTNTGNNTLAAALGDRSAQQTSVVKSGPGQWVLSGANTYSGTTTVNGGTLTYNSLAGQTAVTVNNGGTLAGLGNATLGGSVVVNSGGNLQSSGNIAGAVTINSGGSFSPGNGMVGNLSVGSLWLGTGTTLNFIFANTTSYDQVFVQNASGLEVDSGVSLYLYSPSLLPWTSTGNFNLFGYSGTITGNPSANLSVANPQSGLVYHFVETGGFVQLQITSAGLANSWSLAGSGSWGTAGDWTSGVPASSVTANFTSAISSAATVTLDGNHTVTGLYFSNTNSYTLAQGSGNGSLTLNNGANAASIGVGTGNHTINAPLLLGAGGLSANIAAGSGLTVSGSIGQTTRASLTKFGNGLLTLSGPSTYNGSTTISAGTLQVTSLANGGVASPLGISTNASSNILVNGGTLQYVGTGSSTDRLFTIGPNGATLDASGAGAVSFSNPGTLGFSSPDTPANLTLSGNSSAANTLAAAIIDNGLGQTSVTKTGPGIWAITGNNTYSGTMTLSGGTLSLASLKNGGVTAQTATIATSVLATFTHYGSTSVTVTDAAGTANLSIGQIVTGSNIPTGTYITDISIDGQTVTLSNAANSTASITLDYLGLATITPLLDVSTLNVGEGVTGPGIPDGTTVIATDPTNGTVTLSQTPTETGTNTLSFADANALGLSSSDASNVLINGGTLQYTGTGDSSDRLFTVGSNGATLDSSGTGALILTNAGGLAFANTSAAVLTLTGNNTGNNTLAAFIADNSLGGATSVVKSGNGTWLLSAFNTYTGGTIINGGVLQADNLGGTSGGLVLGNGTLEAIYGFTVSGLIVINNANSTVQVDNGATVIFGGVVSGAGTLNVTGNGTLSLNTANTYTGGTVVNGAALALGASASAGTGAIALNNANLTINANNYVVTNPIGVTAGANDTLTLNGGNSNTLSSTVSGGGTLNLSVAKLVTLPTTAQFSGFNGTLNVISNSGGIRLQNAADHGLGNTTLILTGSLYTRDGGTQSLGSLSGDVNAILSGATPTNATTTWQVGGLNVDSTYSGSIVDGPNGTASATALTKVGTATLTLAGTGSYSGNTTVNAGTLTLGSGTAASPSSTLSVASGANFNVNGQSATVGALTGAGNITLAGGALSAGANNLSTTFNGLITGVGSLTKLGNGNLTLSGAAGPLTYTGPTTVTVGRLIVNSLVTGSDFTVGSGAALGGNGTITGNLNVQAGGKLLPGTVPTTLTVGNFTWNTDGTPSLLFALSNTDNSSSRLILTGSLIQGSTPGGAGQFVFDFQGTGFFSGVPYNLIDFASGQDAGFAASDFSYVNLATGLTGSFSLNDTTGELQFNVSPVPEPAAWAAIFGGTALSAAKLRRRSNAWAAKAHIT